MPSFLAVAKMYPHAAQLYDPQSAGHRMGRHDSQEVFHAIQYRLSRCASADFEDDYTGALFRGKPRHLPEIMIQRDKSSPLASSGCKQPLVPGTPKALIPNGHHVVTDSLEKLQSPASDVLVELELHAYPAIGTGTMRSRDASAP
jgi:hypothetical protein